MHISLKQDTAVGDSLPFRCCYVMLEHYIAYKTCWRKVRHADGEYHFAPGI